MRGFLGMLVMPALFVAVGVYALRTEHLAISVACLVAAACLSPVKKADP